LVVFRYGGSGVNLVCPWSTPHPGELDVANAVLQALDAS